MADHCTHIDDETIRDDIRPQYVEGIHIQDETVIDNINSFNIKDTHSGEEHHKIHPSGEHYHHRHRHHHRGSHHQKRRHYKHSAKQSHVACLSDSSSESREVSNVNGGLLNFETQTFLGRKSNCEHSPLCPSPIDALMDDRLLPLPLAEAQITPVESSGLKIEAELPLSTSLYGAKQTLLLPGVKHRKEENMKLLEKYINRCHVNYEYVESKITSTFSTLSFVLNHRRKVLLDEAKLKRDQKLRILNEIREEMLHHETTSPKYKEHQSNSVDTEIKDESEEPLLYDNIHEPWICNTPLPNEKNENNEFGNNQVLNSLSSSIENLSDDPDKLLCFQSLQEGNMIFSYDEEIVHLISKIGSIDENLSSPQRSTVEDMKGFYGLTGVKVQFKIVTRDIEGEINYNEVDVIDVRVYDHNKNKVHVEQSPSLLREGIYLCSFVPMEPGRYEIVVVLNDIEVSQSPRMFIAYQKLDLTIKKSKHMTEPMDFVQSYESFNEDGDHNSVVVQQDCIILKRKESSILNSAKTEPYQIYANEEMQSDCGWQFRVTTACPNIVLTIGVKTNSGIADLDEQFTCDFRMGTRGEQSFSGSTRATLRRQETSFTCVPWIFSVLLTHDLLRIKCLENNEEKMVKINRKETFPLYPFCSMLHHHDTKTLQVCPRPQLSFL